MCFFQDHLRSERTDIDGILSSLISYVGNAIRHALLPMDERSQAVERRAEELKEQLNNKIEELRKNISDLRLISDTEDPIYFLQVTEAILYKYRSFGVSHCLRYSKVND